MSKIPRLDRNSSTGVSVNSAIISKNSPTKGTKIPIPISPRKSSNNYNIPPLPNITETLPHPVAPLQLDHADIRDISTPSHFHDNDSELDALSPLNSVEVPLAQSREEVELSLSPLQLETSSKLVSDTKLLGGGDTGRGAPQELCIRSLNLENKLFSLYLCNKTTNKTGLDLHLSK